MKCYRRISYFEIFNYAISYLADRSNVFFHSAKDFKQQILSFCTDNWDKNKVGLEDRITDDF